MDLFDRYLHAVRSFLPTRQQDDVVRELSEDLRSHAEEREEELGRRLNEEEQAAILKQFGHPLLLASRYQPQRQLIGSAVFPIYWLVLRISLGVALLVHIVASGVLLLNGTAPGEVIAHLVTLPFGPLLMVFAWVTVVFALLDQEMVRRPFLASWNPSALPRPSRDAVAPSFACLITDVVMATLFVLWLAAVPANQWLMFGPASGLIELGPVWHQMHIPLLLLASAGLASAWVKLLRPEWRTFRVASKLAGNVVTIAVFVVLLNADPLIVPAAASDGADSIAAVVNIGMRMGFTATAAVIAAMTLYEVGRLLARRLVPGRWSPHRS